jgi:hypothetical protein
MAVPKMGDDNPAPATTRFKLLAHGRDISCERAQTRVSSLIQLDRDSWAGTTPIKVSLEANFRFDAIPGRSGKKAATPNISPKANRHRKT